MKKGSLLLGSILLSISGVYANPLTDNIRRGSAGVAEIFSALFGPFFGGLLNAPKELLFENILLFFVIFAATFMSVKQIKVLKDNKAIVAIVTVSVAILASRFVSIQFIYSVLLPYQVFGIVLSAFLPILIGFFFIHGIEQPILRRMFWIFFVVVFIAMWGTNYDNAGSAGWIYFWSALASLIFFIFDGTIRRAFLRARFSEQNRKANMESVREIRRDLRELNKDRKNKIIGEDEYQETKKEYMKQIHELAKY